MEAIKKKMQAMKVEKDNLCDRSDVVEQQTKDAMIRKEKAEEEFTELTLKSRTLEIDNDKFGLKLINQVMAQEAKEAQVLAAEAEFNRLNRRVQELEEDLEITEQKYVLAIQKYDKAATAADDSDRMAKVLQNRATEDEAKLVGLSDELKKAQHRAEEADKKMVEAEGKLEIDGERADVSEFKIIELEEELKVVANNLKSLEVSEDKANQREDFYKTEIKRLTGKPKQSETRAEFAEKSVVKLQKEVDRLEDELVGEQDKFKAITEELDATFAEMSGY